MKKDKLYYILFVLYFLSIYFISVANYLHYFILLLLLGFTIIDTKYNNTNKNKNNNLLIYFISFFLYILFSYLWKQGNTSSQMSIIKSIIKNAAIVFCILRYMDDEQRVFNIIKIFVHVTLFIGILYYLTSPISTWGSTSMGTVLGIWRNSAGYYFAFASFMSLFLYKYYGKNKFNLVSFLILFAMSVMTGSRKCIIHVIMLLFIMTFIEKGRKIKIKNLLILVLVFIIGFLVVKYNSYANNIFNTKILSLFSGNANRDASTLVRKYYIEYAFKLFLQKPLFGWGLDGFKVWLQTQTEFLTRWSIEKATYSHCNYVELLANSGIIGFGLYYLYPIFLLIKNYRNRDNNIVRFGITNLIVFIIMDYGTISYYMYIYIIILTISLVCINIGKNNLIGDKVEK